MKTNLQSFKYAFVGWVFFPSLGPARYVILIIIDCGSEAGRDHSILLGTTGDSLLGFLNISINTLTTKTGHLKLSLPEIQTLVHEGLL